MPSTLPSSGSADDSAERALLRGLVDEIGADTRVAARVHASLIRRRAAAMRIALTQAARSGSRVSRERELPVRSVALEIAVATRSSDLTVQRELSDALTLTEKFPATVAALEGGHITPPHARAILDTGIVLDDADTRAGWEKIVLDRAERDSPARLRAFARELAESVHPVGMSVRHARAAASRGVAVRDLADGMAELSVILPATVAYGIRDRLRRQAAAIRAANDDDADGNHADGAPAQLGTASAEPDARRDERTVAQIGADLCADLLLTAAPTVDPTTERTCPGGLGAIRAHVQITVPALTLLGRSDSGATVGGSSPIHPETARRLAADAPGWDRVLCHPVTGTVLEVDRYTPTAAQRRYLAARDRHCRAPGCRAPISRCQVDHNHEAQHGGATRLANLCHLCVRHHTLKTETAWTVTQHRDGTLLFQSPLGQQVTEAPPPRVVFVPDPSTTSSAPPPTDVPPF